MIQQEQPVVEPAPDKVRRCVRTSSVKIRTGDPAFADDLAFTATAIGRKAVALMGFLIAAKGDPYWDGDRVVSQDEVLAEQARYAHGANPAIIRAMLREFFDAVMTGDHNIVISYMSPLYKADSQIATTTRISRKTGKVNEVEAGKLVCRRLLDAGIFPVVADDLPGGAFQRSAWISAFMAVRSWYEADKRFAAETKSLRDEAGKLDERTAGLDAGLRGLAVAFIAAMDQDGRRIDRQFAKRWKIVRRALLSGRGARQGEPEFFAPFRPLWDERDHITAIAGAEAIRRRLVARPIGARFPKLKHVDVPILTCISRSNTLPITLASHEGAVVGNVVLIDSTATETTRAHDFTCLRSRYFMDLVLTTQVKGATKVAIAEYRKGNRDLVPVSAEIKEPRIRRIHGEWYLDLIHGVAIAPPSDRFVSSKDAFDQVGFFINHKSPLAPADVRPGLRVLSIDLGINPAMAFAVYRLDHHHDDPSVEDLEVPGIGWAIHEASGKLGGTRDLDYHRDIQRFRQRLDCVKRLIRFRGRLLNPAPDGKLHPAYLESVALAFQQAGIASCREPVQLKRALLDAMSELRNVYVRLRDSRTRKTGLMREQFEWAGAIREYVQMMKTWRYGGPKVEGQPRPDTTGDFARYYRYGAGVRKDTLRKVAAEVRRLAVEHQVDVVLVEDLEYFRMSVEHEKGTNSLLSLWSPAAILNWITNALQPHGINVLRIDPRHTSRIDPATGEFGFYDFRADKSVLVVERDGRAEVLDADIAAAQNLQRRYWRRNTEPYRLECYPDGAGMVPEIGVQAGRYFQALAGSPAGRLVGDQFVPMTAAAHKRAIAQAKKGADGEKWYRFGETWVSRADHIARLDAIIERFGSQAPLDERAKSYLAKVNGLRNKELRANKTGYGT